MSCTSPFAPSPPLADRVAVGAYAVASAGAAWLAPASAAACSVCFGGGGGEESRVAFIATTVFLSVLPLAMIGGLVWWIWRRTRAVEAARSAALAPVAPSGRAG